MGQGTIEEVLAGGPGAGGPDMVLDIEEDYDSQGAAIRVVAEQIGWSTDALRRSI